MELRRLRLEREVVQFEVRLDATHGLKLRPMLAEELRHLRPRDAHRRAKEIAHRRRNAERLKRAVVPGPAGAELKQVRHRA